MTPERIMEELEVLAEWDTDMLVDTLNITNEELLEIQEFLRRGIEWIEENFDE